MTDNLVSKKLNILLLQTQTIIFLIFVVLFQLNDQIDLLLIFYTLDTKQRFGINNTNTTKLDKMTGDIRCTSDQGGIAYFFNLYNIIRYKTVSSVDQLQCNLGLDRKSVV